MALYSFYALRSDGSSDGFATSYLADDEEASHTAQGLLERHARASRVVVVFGDRELFVRQRGDPASAGGGPRPS